MHCRESYVEMNINANDDTNATIDIDDADRVVVVIVPSVVKDCHLAEVRTVRTTI